MSRMRVSYVTSVHQVCYELGVRSRLTQETKKGDHLVQDDALGLGWVRPHRVYDLQKQHNGPAPNKACNTQTSLETWTAPLQQYRDLC